jgi:hypothetical protein
MLQIRGEQFDALDRAAREAFEQELLAHLKQFGPEHVKAVGDDGTLKVIRLGIERAAGHGFTFRGPIRFYVELMFQFGSGFATDPQLPWAAAALADRPAADQLIRAEALYQRYQEYYAGVVGPGAAFARAAARRAAGLKPADLDIPAGPDRAGVMIGKMKEYYPEKAAAAGDAVLAGLLTRGEQRAAAHGITSPRGGMLFAVLMFAFGHQIDTDPVYPWVEGTLTSDRADDPDRRVERVATKTLLFGARAAANLGRS